MAETNPGNFMSPEAVIMLPLAAILDLVGIILICFALDDFFITDIIGWLTLGVWSMVRSQVKGGEEVSLPDTEGKRELRGKMKDQKGAAGAAEKTTQETGKTAVKTAKAGKWAKWIRFLEFIPYVGVLPFWTISTFFILKNEE
jgi:hypothetical protein